MFTAVVNAQSQNVKEEWGVQIVAGVAYDIDAQLDSAPDGLTLRKAFAPVEKFFEAVPEQASDNTFEHPADEPDHQ